MQTLASITFLVAAALGGLMALLWVWAFVALDFRRCLPWLRGLSPVTLLASSAALFTAASPGQWALAGTALLLPSVFFVVQRISRQPDRPAAVAPGDDVLEFSALDARGQRFELASLRGRPYLLKFYRGHWCPYCRMELYAWSAMADELAARGVAFVAISPDTPEEVARFARDHANYRMHFLSDADLRVTDRYGLRSFKTLALGRGREKLRVLAIPTTILVDASGVVRWIDQSEDHQIRSDPGRVLPAIDTALGRPAAASVTLPNAAEPLG